MNTSRWLLFVLLMSLLSIARGDTPQQVVLTNTSTQWPLFRGDAQSQGVAKCELPAKPDLLWNVEIKGGSFDSSPAIVDGVVYIGDLDGELRAFDLKTGDKKWEYPTDSGFMAPAAVSNGRVYIGDMDGRMHCVNAATGKGIWTFETQAEIDGSANFLDDTVLFGSQDATLYCLNAETAKEVWRFSIADQIRCTPTLVMDAKGASVAMAVGVDALRCSWPT
jgi:outer membrane protein assembly factor BamB